MNRRKQERKPGWLELIATRLPHAAKVEIAARAKAAGRTVSGYVHDVIMEHLQDPALNSPRES